MLYAAVGVAYWGRCCRLGMGTRKFVAAILAVLLGCVSVPAEPLVAPSARAEAAEDLVAPTISRAASLGGAIEVCWDYAQPAGGVKGYRVYRQKDGANEWSLAADLPSRNVRSYLDASAANGVLYRYSVVAYSGASESDASAPVESCYVAPPKIKAFKRRSEKSFMVRWSKNSKASGYQLQYSKSNIFSSKKTQKIVGGSTMQKTIKGVAAKKTYYVRARAYVKRDGKTYYSSWSHSPNTKTTRSLSLSAQKRKSKTFELRAYAKQAMYGYDTVQGSCTDGAYGYYCLYNRNVEKCKIVKVKLSTMKVAKVSKALDIAHGNDMAYDSQHKLLVVVHATGHGRRLSAVNPSTLKVNQVIDVTVPKGLAGATEAQRKAAKGFSGIAYNERRNQYIVLLGGSHDFLILDGDMRPLRYVAADYKSTMVYQGIDATDDYLFVAVSPRTVRQANAVLVYTWDGGFVGKLNLKGIDEIESIYHVGSKFYASVYRSYCKTYYTKQKRTIEVDGSRKVKTIKIRHRALKRDNYIYRIKGA